MVTSSYISPSLTNCLKMFMIQGGFEHITKATNSTDGDQVNQRSQRDGSKLCYAHANSS